MIWLIIFSLKALLPSFPFWFGEINPKQCIKINITTTVGKYKMKHRNNQELCEAYDLGNDILAYEVFLKFLEGQLR